MKNVLHISFAMALLVCCGTVQNNVSGQGLFTVSNISVNGNTCSADIELQSLVRDTFTMQSLTLTPDDDALSLTPASFSFSELQTLFDQTILALGVTTRGNIRFEISEIASGASVDVQMTVIGSSTTGLPVVLSTPIICARQ